jgi:hypothetical protein
MTIVLMVDTMSEAVRHRPINKRSIRSATKCSARSRFSCDGIIVAGYRMEKCAAMPMRQ